MKKTEKGKYGLVLQYGIIKNIGICKTDRWGGWHLLGKKKNKRRRKKTSKLCVSGCKQKVCAASRGYQPCQTPWYSLLFILLYEWQAHYKDHCRNYSLLFQHEHNFHCLFFKICIYESLLPFFNFPIPACVKKEHDCAVILETSRHVVKVSQLNHLTRRRCCSTVMVRWNVKWKWDMREIWA